MIYYIGRRLAFMLLSLFLLSFVSYVIIELPPGDYAEMYIKRLETSGTRVDESLLLNLKRRYGYDQPFMTRYLNWIRDVVTRGDFGISLLWDRSVTTMILDRLPFTVVLSFVTLLFTYAVAIPIGIYSATHQYSLGDYVSIFVGFIGLAVPDFLLALVLMYVLLTQFGVSPGGLFSPEYEDAAWSAAKFWDLLKHLIVPIVIVGSSSARWKGR